MNISDEDLMAYADNELSGAKKAQITAAILANPKLRDRVAAHRAVAEASRAAFSNEPPLSEGLETLMNSVTSSVNNDLIDLPNTQNRWRWPAAIAATFFGAVFFGQTMLQNNSLIVNIDGRAMAGSELTKVLTQVPSQSGHNDIWIETSFVADNGQYCREFKMGQGLTQSGIACRQDDTWPVMVIAANPNIPDDAARPAGAESDPIATMVVRLGVKKILSSSEEAEIMKNKWK